MLSYEASPPVFAYKGFSVRVGRVVGGDRHDLRHYLIINDAHDVIEASVEQLIQARLICASLGEETAKQTEKINQNVSLFANEHWANGNERKNGNRH